MAEKSFGAKKIKLDGSGTPTIQSPSTLNLDAVTVGISTNLTVGGQVKIDNELRTNRIVPNGGLVSGASGGVIQVVFAENNTVQTFSFANNSFSPQTVCSCTITPQSSSSKILVYCSAGVFVDNETGMNFEWSLHLKRGSTLVGGNTQSNHFLGTNVLCSGINSVESASTGNFHYMDSPATTSATTYNLCLQGGEARTYGVGRSKYNSPSTKYNYQNSSGCTITLMEITG